jgi:sugar (pentulose or hexulose) kinase
LRQPGVDEGAAGAEAEAGADSLIRVKDVYEPDEARHRIYQENFMVFSVLYDRLKDLM